MGGFQVAMAEVSAPPSRETMLSLHAARKGKRNIILVVAAVNGDNMLTRDCIILCLGSSQPGERTFQLMGVGTFALDNLTGRRTVTPGERDSNRQLMTDPEYRGFGWSEVKHPKALQSYRMCAARGWLG